MPRSSAPRRSRGGDDYVDAFELRWAGPDEHSPEQWARTGLEGAPRVVRAVIVVAHRVVLGFRLGPHDSPDHVLGWPVTRRTPGEIELRASSWLVDGVIAARRVDPCTARLTTSLHFRRRAGRLLWVVSGS